MNSLIAFCLVVSSLAAAGVWSPSTPDKQEQGEQVIVKEGHRTIIVEYEPDHVHGHPNTIVSISPEQHHHLHKPDSINAKENIKKASSSFLPNPGHDQGPSQSSGNAERAEAQVTPKELICDALGKCKHKITTAMGKAKDMVSETAHEAVDKTKGMTHKAKDEAKETAQVVGEATAHAFDKAKETVSKKAQEVGERAKDNVKNAADKVKGAKDIGKAVADHIAKNVTHKVEMAKEEMVEKAKEAKETAEQAADKLKKETKKELRGIVERGREVGRGALRYANSPKARRSLMFVLNLLGLATAYGMCVWVTFISSYILNGAMPKQQFGMIQSKIYPVYFSAMAASIGTALVGFLFGNAKTLFSIKAEMFQGYFLLASLLMVFVNLLYLEPRATKVMFERMKMEKEEGRGTVTEELIAERRPSDRQQDADPAVSTTTSTCAVPAAASPRAAKQEVIRIRIVRLNGRLKKLNTYSSFLNILTLMALNWHLVYLSQRLHLSC